MFDQFRNLAKLKGIEKALSQEKVEVIKQGVKVVINGRFEVEEIALNPSIPVQDQSKVLKTCLNEAFRKIQSKALEKMLKIK